MFRKILYPTDFSDVSKKALDYIKQLKKGGAEAVILVHVIDQRGIRAIEWSAAATALKMEQELMAQAGEDLKKIEEILKKWGFQVETRLEIGFPVREILNVEKEEDVSVIVIGSHGKSNLEEMFLGSVSEKVARKCTKPILIIKR
ncbi:MAG: universal stress protein [Proteobacteria bacterium]|jgi:nucleotide-binding universal stress UspA family protein|nr:universal stress protein [Pseudomonadota bacterium]MBU1902501.1 universal stress protein [Pseudomonadota bacterium]